MIGMKRWKWMERINAKENIVELGSVLKLERWKKWSIQSQIPCEKVHVVYARRWQRMNVEEWIESMQKKIEGMKSMYVENRGGMKKNCAEKRRGMKKMYAEKEGEWREIMQKK